MIFSCIYYFFPTQGFCMFVMSSLLSSLSFCKHSVDLEALFVSAIQLIWQILHRQFGLQLNDGSILIALDYYISIVGFGIHDKARKCHGYVTVIKEGLENDTNENQNLRENSNAI